MKAEFIGIVLAPESPSTYGAKFIFEPNPVVVLSLFPV
jgi:hypothetical protein